MLVFYQRTFTFQVTVVLDTVRADWPPRAAMQGGLRIYDISVARKQRPCQNVIKYHLGIFSCGSKHG